MVQNDYDLIQSYVNKVKQINEGFKDGLFQELQVIGNQLMSNGWSQDQLNVVAKVFVEMMCLHE